MTTTRLGRLLLTATWMPLHGDPAATERGRWVVEDPAIGAVTTLALPEDAVDDVIARLRDDLAATGVDDPLVTVTSAAGRPVVTAYDEGDVGHLAVPEGASGREAERVRVIADLRRLLDYLDAHPELPIKPETTRLIYPVSAYVDGGLDAEMAELERIRQEVGADAAQPPDYETGSHPSVAVASGAASMRWYVVPSRSAEPPACGPACGPVPPRTGIAWSVTPTRRALLREVAVGDVVAEAGQAWHLIDGKRTARIVEALAAGWVVEGRQDRPGRRTYELTGAGREAAEAYDRTEGGAS